MLDATRMEIISPVIKTTSNRGFTPDELADNAVDRIVSISENVSDPVVKAQALVFKDHVRRVLVDSMQQSIRSYRTTLIAELTKAGHEDMALIIKNL